MKNSSQKLPLKSKLSSTFELYTGYELKNFTSLDRFTRWLHRPVDSSALGVFRIFFGLAMLIDAAEERGGSQMDIRFGDDKTCHFPLFDFIQALSLPTMGLVYLLMSIGALGIALGYNFKSSCLAFVCCYWYLLLLEKPAWNNHSYLFGLCGMLMMTTSAHSFCALDSPHTLQDPTFVPYWNYFLIKFQFFILYAYAGLKKFSTEWLSGYSMSNLGHHWLFAPFRSVFSVEMIELLVVHWLTAVFDFTIPFLMTFKRTRHFSTPFMLSFHLMNSRLFAIGMFPWVCLAEVPLFFGFDWPRQLTERMFKVEKKEKDSKDLNPEKLKVTDSKTNIRTNRRNSDLINSSPVALPSKESWKEKLRTIFILIYCLIQLFLPYSHFITKGYNNWTNGLYGYSWDMMVHSYDTVLTSVKVVDNNNGNVHFMEPFAFTQFDRWTKSADMAVQYAKCINRNIIREMSKNPLKSPISSVNISIYFDIWCSMNGRFQQRVFDPTVDLLKAPWSPFKKTSWILPLLNELNYLRPKLKSIADDVLSWNNYSDVIFVADFPGLTLENFISTDLNNVTLTVIEGSITYKNGSFEKRLSSGNSLSPLPGQVHHITTTSKQPSCYFYTFVNKTMEKLQISPDNDLLKSKNNLPLWREFKERINNYKLFLYHIFNSVMFILYKVPMPISIREL